MTGMILSWILNILLGLFGVVGIWYIYFKTWGRYFWARRNIPYEEPYFLAGNTKDATHKLPLKTVLDGLYKKHREKPLLGMWTYLRPNVLLIDVELIKNVLVKDFSFFHDRGISANYEREPLLEHLFNMDGQQWRNMRVKLTPTFTSGKMKMMYDTMYDVGHKLQNYLEKKIGSTLEMKEVLAQYTTDIIASCAFGIEANSLDNPDSDFRKYGRLVFNPPIHILISGILLFVAPKTGDYLPLRQMPRAVSDFFMKVVKDVIQYREESNVKRRDFMELLIELKQKGTIDDADSKYDKHEEDILGDPFTIEQAAAQAFVFFFAGFETSSTALVWALYELALNPEIQKELQKEVDKTIRDGKISYNALQDMAYMEQIVQETLRKYPPVPLLFRECSKDYNVPDSDIVLKQGDFILIPIDSIQNDPAYFPDPEKFDPERFSQEMRQGRDSFLELAFGSGPRICIGNRFAMLQVKVALASIFSKYNVEIAHETTVPAVLDPKMFFPSPKGGMHLKITPRT